MGAPTLTSRQVAALRLRTLGIVRPPGAPPTTPVQVVAHHLAMQGQDFPASRWAIGSRIPGCTEADIAAAYASGELVRSWPMRGTVFVTLAQDLPWMLKLTGVRALSPASLKRRWDLLGMTEERLERARELTIATLRGGGRITRTALGEVLAAHGHETGGQGMYHTVWYLAQTGTLVQGPMIGNEHGLVLLDEWVPTPREPSRDEALRELVTRYLASHGPATLEDMVWWSGLTKGDLRAGLEHAGDTLTTATHADTGDTLWMAADALDVHDPTPSKVARTTQALAGFDEHLLGYARRDDVLHGDHAAAVDPARNGVFRATIVHGGRVVGTWRVTRRTRGVRVDVTPLTTLTAAQTTGARTALTRWAAFRGTELLDLAVT